MKNTKLPEISVIISVYNNGKYLSDALNSLKRQTFKNFEVIFINDGSTDNSLKIAEKYAQKDKRIRIFSLKKNKGKSRAINRFIKNARGVYISFLDGDDLLKQNRLSGQLNFMKKERLDASYCDMTFLYKKGKTKLRKSLDFRNNFRKRLMEKAREDFDLKLRPGHHLDPQGKYLAGFWGGMMLKRKILKDCKIDSSLDRMEDHDFWFQLIGKRYKIERFPRATYIYRQHPHQMSNNTKKGDFAAIKINKKLKRGIYFK